MLIVDSFVNVELLRLIFGGMVMHNIVISEDACPEGQSVRHQPYGLIYCLLPEILMIMIFLVDFQFSAW